MNRALKTLSVLLSYPEPELQESKEALCAALTDADLLLPSQKTALEILISRLTSDDIYDLQAEYVELFERSRGLSLNLFEHIFGESRDRGTAMVELLENYRKKGLEPTSSELPDHLPVLLEFLALVEPEELREALGNLQELLARLKIRLERKGSDYACVFAALLAAAGAHPDYEKSLTEEEDNISSPDDLAALDKAWEEEPVTFGPDAGAGCSGTRDLLNNLATTPETDPETAFERPAFERTDRGPL